MPAGVRHQDLVVTGGALSLHQGTVRGTAVLHRSQGLAMGRQDRILVLRQERRFKVLDKR